MTSKAAFQYLRILGVLLSVEWWPSYRWCYVLEYLDESTCIISFSQLKLLNTTPSCHQSGGDPAATETSDCGKVQWASDGDVAIDRAVSPSTTHPASWRPSGKWVRRRGDVCHTRHPHYCSGVGDVSIARRGDSWEKGEFLSLKGPYLRLVSCLASSGYSSSPRL